MLKKFASLILCICLLVGITAMPDWASAANTVTITEDNLENASVGINYSSDLIASTGKYISVEKGVGYGASAGFKVNNNSGGKSDSNLVTKAIKLNDNETVLLEYKFNIESIANDVGGKIIYMSVGGVTDGRSVFTIRKDSSNNWYFGSGSGGKPHYYFSYDKWYTMVIELKKGSVAKGYLFDESGTLHSTFKNATAVAADAASVSVYAFAGMKNGIVAYLDDFRVYRVGSQSLDLDTEKCSVSNGDTNVSQDSVTIAFNQPLAKLEDGAITLSSGGSEIGAKIAYSYANTVRITPVNGFTPGTSYVVKITSPSSVTGASYAGASEIAFRTARGLTYTEDNFEGVAAGTSGSSYTASAVLAKGTAEMTVEAGAGFDGTKGYRVNTSGTKDAILYAKTVSWDDIDSSETIFLEYKLKIKSAERVTANTPFVFIGNTNGSITNGWTNFTISEPKDSSMDKEMGIADGSAGSKKNFPVNEWCTVVLKIRKNYATTGYFYDNNGTVIQEVAASNTWTSGDLKIYPFAVIKHKIDAVLDDFKMYCLSSEKLNIKESSVAHGQTEAAIGKYITLTFNQPLAKENAASTEAIGLYVGETKVEADICRIGANVIRITPDVMLAGETTYTIKISDAIDALSGNGYDGIKTISFTTKRLYPVEVTATNLLITDDSTVESGNYTVSFDNSGDTVSDAVIVVACYDSSRPKKLVGMEILKDDITEGSDTINIQLENSYQNVKSVEVLLYESLKTMKSIMYGHIITK